MFKTADLILKLACLGRNYIRKVFGLGSALILCAMTIDRSFFILFPTKAKLLSTKKTTLIIIALIMVINAGANTIFFAIYDRALILINPENKYSSIYFCIAKSSAWEVYLRKITPAIEIVFLYFLPSAIFMITNSLMIYHLIVAGKKRDKMTNNPQAKSTNKGRNSTVILLLISTYYIVVAIPNSMLLVYVRYYLTEPTIDDSVFLKKGALFCRLLSSSNSCFNFYFYCLSGNRFRNEFLSLFKKRQEKPESQTAISRVSSKF